MLTHVQIGLWTRQVVAIASSERSALSKDAARSDEKLSGEPDWLDKLVFEKSTELSDLAERVGFGLATWEDLNRYVAALVSMLVPEQKSNIEKTLVPALLYHVSQSLVRAFEINSTVGKEVYKIVSSAAVVARSRDIAFVVNPEMQLVGANTEAFETFQYGSLLSISANTIKFQNEDAAKWTYQALKHVHQSTHIFRHVQDLWRISLETLPDNNVAFGRFGSSSRLAIILLRNLSSPGSGSDISSIIQAFDLTPAEVKLCLALNEGMTLSKAAGSLGITKETARDRLKVVFQKTGTNRQAQLVAFLTRLS